MHPDVLIRVLRCFVCTYVLYVNYMIGSIVRRMSVFVISFGVKSITRNRMSKSVVAFSLFS